MPKREREPDDEGPAKKKVKVDPVVPPAQHMPEDTEGPDDTGGESKPRRP